MRVLGVHALRKSFGDAGARVDVLKGVDLNLNQGELLALTGESGSGKSTLLHLIAALDQADAGEIYFGKLNVSTFDEASRAEHRRNRVAIVFQQFNLVPSLNVFDNIVFQARLADRYDQGWAMHLAERLGIAGLCARYPEQLSGGQQQRVAIGRALAARAPLVLADEPTGNLDEETGDQVLELFRDLIRETGASFIMATHSSRLAGLMDRRVHLTGGIVS